ncbi:MAG: putative minor capsid protein [Gordonibacter sp.]|uniref:putative minor capsid protein n=1 Tax=Gordonibacter sp. TaxID=1968902 RepID=UPI002FC91BF4
MGAVLPPIPLSLLPDDMSVRVPVDSDYGGEHSADSVLVRHVRFVDSSAMARKGYVLSDGSKGLVYVDAANSDGAFVIPVGSLVKIGDDDLSIVKVVPCKGFFGVIHHWEIEVR